MQAYMKRGVRMPIYRYLGSAKASASTRRENFDKDTAAYSIGGPVDISVYKTSLNGSKYASGYTSIEYLDDTGALKSERVSWGTTFREIKNVLSLTAFASISGSFSSSTASISAYSTRSLKKLVLTNRAQTKYLITANDGKCIFVDRLPIEDMKVDPYKEGLFETAYNTYAYDSMQLTSIQTVKGKIAKKNGLLKIQIGA